MNKLILTIFIVMGFFITFSDLLIPKKATVKDAEGVLNRTLEKENTAPKKGVYYTIDHRTKEITMWKKPEGVE